jgi:phosphatidylserine/phosphatidylglycerophosphate/cardiolipin synthase-like enzyme
MRSNILLLLFCFFFYLAPQYAVAEELNSDSLTIVDLKELGIQFAGNNKIQLITSGAEKFELMFDEIQKAQKYV